MEESVTRNASDVTPIQQPFRQVGGHAGSGWLFALVRLLRKEKADPGSLAGMTDDWAPASAGKKACVTGVNPVTSIDTPAAVVGRLSRKEKVDP
jgi:hypothetical protein